MSSPESVKLTSSEMASLWDAYISNTHTACVLKHFVAVAEDSDVLKLLSETLEVIQNAEQKTKKILESENIPIPIGFTDQDVDVNAPRLFTDTFSLLYIKNMARVMLAACSLMYSMSTRKDIRNHFKECINRGTDIFDSVSDLLLAKGTYIRPPFIEPPKEVDFIENKDYVNGKNFFKDQRYLNAIEISHIFANIESNVVGNALTQAFGQTADLKQIRDFMGDAGQLCTKVVNTLTEYLTGSKLPAPMGSDTHVYSSPKPPFSDKLMAYEMSVLIATALSDYATSMAASMRNDLKSHYMDLLEDTLKIGKKAEDIMIEHAWLEQPPQQDKLTR
ncbi:DUF3231 family protein [Bacillus salacetis]|uniref:DUF3231 family protein n=1 Tax=Bacillus salacetis TaxID=2315464 RepID=UPI003B9E88E3